MMRAVQIRVCFYSLCRDLTGAHEMVESMPPGSRVDDLLSKIFARHPALTGIRNSLRVAVGVDYQGGDCLLQEGDEVSLLPPMQGG
jgi:molybdopterin synthase sulfur carrier subunit